MMAEVSAQDLSYCADMVEKGDPDRFAAAMLAPMPLRARLMALYAFNLELAKLREIVREPMLGEIRLQWWRDAVEECFTGSPRRHQVVQPLAAAIAEGDLSKESLMAVIDVRARDLDELPPSNEAELKLYIAQSGGVLGELALTSAIGAGGTEVDLGTARAAGRAWAWIGLARGLHSHRVQGRRTVPAGWVSRGSTLDDDILKANPSDPVRRWVAWLVDQADSELASVRKGQGALSKEGRVVLAPARLAVLYRTRLKKSGYNPFIAELNQLTPLRRSWALIGFTVRGNRV